MRTIDLSEPLTLADVLDVAHARAVPTLGEPGRARMQAARAVVDAYLSTPEVPRYGINTGFGALAEVVIPTAKVAELQQNLIRSHATGVGALLPTAVVRAVALLRAQVLAAGHSGVRPALVDLLCGLLREGVHPLIPCQGSVGASGDLAPLAHLALVLTGEGRAEYRGDVLNGGEALRRAGLQPVQLQAKEGLSLINGTQVMTAIGVLALDRAERLARAADIAGAMTVEAQLGTTRAFDPRIEALRTHPGHAVVAGNLRRLCADSPLIASHAGPDCHKVQDPYSLRCMPQVHGAVRDALDFTRRTLAVEINAVTDNPLIFPESWQAGEDASEVIVSGGNFHGQPVSIACDVARLALVSLASMSERRIEQLVNPALSSGLPAFLAHDSGLNSGFMIAQVTAAALVSESKGLATPASIDSIPSSANREDHVSMGPIAARRLQDVVDNGERVVGIELLCAAQGLDFRSPLGPGIGTRAAWQAVRARVPTLAQDRVLADDIETAAELVRSGALEAAVEAALGRGLT
jgi:histidine ammonia-lyase